MGRKATGAGSEIFDYWQDSSVKTAGGNTFGYFTDADRLDASVDTGHWQGRVDRRKASGSAAEQSDLEWVQWGLPPPPALVGLVSRGIAKEALQLAIDSKQEQQGDGGDLTPERLVLIAMQSGE
jgi:hypothetical protein